MATYAGRYSEDLQDRYGNGYRNATVAVQTLAGAAVTLYADRSKTAYVPASGLAANEIKADANGNLIFFADPGNYQIVVTPVGGSTLAPFPVSVLPDPLEPTATGLEERLDLLENTVYDVRLSGAVLDGASDDTAAIQSALDTFGMAFVPEASVRIDGTIQIKLEQALFLHPKSELRRVAAASSTDPIVQFYGNHGRIMGNGLLITEKASPLGVLHYGPLLTSTNRNVLWCNAEVRIEGVQATGNVGCRFNATAPGGGFGTYANRLDGHIARFGTAVLMENEANANEVRANTYLISQYVYHFDSVVEVGILGGFVHNSADVTVLKFNDVVYASVVGLRAEPGGSAKPYEFTACTGCYVQMVNNTALGGTDDDATASNTFILREKIEGGGLHSLHGIQIHPNQYPVVANSWANVQQSSLSFSGAINSSAGTVGASVAWEVGLRGGTWRVDMCHFRGPDRGIYTVELATLSETGAVSAYTALTTIDGYAAAEDHVRSSVTGLSVPASGRKRLRLRMASKSASSSSYLGAFEHLALTRTGA